MGSMDPEEPVPDILGVRRMEHADLMLLEELIRPGTSDLFGDVDLGRIYESSCLSLVQWNEERDVVSGVCLCNYPNVPSITPEDWLSWFHTLYGVENVTERNSMFVHLLVWDSRYTGRFFGDLLTGLFNIAPYLLHVILVHPPKVIRADIFEHRMIKVSAKCLSSVCSVQYLLLGVLENGGSRIRRVVEEDNDIVIPLIDAESSALKELYGEYYVSEMVRYPTECRQLIVSEDTGGLATGVMFLNKNVDVDLLNENFQLDPYNGLRKVHEDDEIPASSMEPASETYFSLFFDKPPQEIPAAPVAYPPSRILEEKEEEEAEEDEEKGEDDDDESINLSASFSRVPEEEQKEKQEEEKLEKRDNEEGKRFFDDREGRNDDERTHFRSSILKESFDFTDDVSRDVSLVQEIDQPTAIQLPSRPIYRGEPNAFVVEIFAAQEWRKPYFSRNFLEAAFECFPELDYCTILLPFSHPPLSFLDNFLRIPVRCNKDFPMSLHVTHRAALLGEIKVRQANSSDRTAVQELLRRLPRGQIILQDFDRVMTEGNSGLFCHLFTWNERIVGAAIYCEETDAAYVRRRFHVEDYISTEDLPRDAYARLLHFVLMPIFAIHLRYFFNELARLSGLIVFYYRFTENSFSALTRLQPLPVCLNAMVHVRPRRRIEYKFRGMTETDQLRDNGEPFALFMTTPRIVSNNLVIDAKIVVVGASDCGVAFLEHLVFGSPDDFARYGNLTLVSPRGLPFETERSAMVSGMIPFRGKYCREYRRMVAARAWINVVYGTVIAINRKDKHVTVKHQGDIAYDYLVITCGLQYQKPKLQEERTAQKRGSWLELEEPWNCLMVNDDSQADTCLEKIRLLTSNFEEQKNIVLYGRNIDCYCALQGLLESGINGSWISLIEPPLQPCESRQTVFFDDCEVYRETVDRIVDSGVKILSEWELINWHLKDSTVGNIIESLVLRSKGKMKIIRCDVLINFLEKTIDSKIFLAFCRTGLMFDGQLVIDPEFRTNDPFIFAAGTSTKYSRKFYAESWQHKYFNSVEIGERLANTVRSVVDNYHRYGEEVSANLKRCKEKRLSIPTFRSPNVVACTLPGGRRYLHVRKPGRIVMRKHPRPYHFLGTEMTTGSCSSEIGLFRLRLNQHDSVEIITCLSKKDFEVRQMIELYGKHESLLNELKMRYKKSLISDLYAYFREPWATAIFHDRFDCLRIENRAILLSKTAIPGQSLVEDCINALNRSNWGPMSENDRRRIILKYSGSAYQQELEENLLQFLQFIEEDAPVYCTPGILRKLYAAVKESPLFSRL